jgi:PAS domain S-box-containing protein
MLSAARKAVLRAGDEPTLYRDVCRIAVEVGGYRTAWIGLSDRGAAPEHSVACAGDHAGDRAAEAAWVVRAMATAEPCVAADRSAIALPLATEGSSVGVLAIGATGPDAFVRAEIDILTELAADVVDGASGLRRRAERDRVATALQERNRHLEAAQRLSHVGHWERDLQTDEALWSDETYRIFGRVPRQPPVSTFSLAEHRQLVHPDDRPRVAAAVSDAIAGRCPYDLEYRLLRSDGEVRWVQSRGIVEHDAGGRAVRMFGVMQDVTDRRRAEESVRSAERQLRTIVEGLPDMVCRFDRDGRFLYVSGTTRRHSGAVVDSIIGRAPVELGLCVDPAEDRALHESIARVVAERRPDRLEVSFQVPAGSGQPRAFEVRHIPEMDEGGNVVGVLGIARDLTERRAAERQLYILNNALDAAGEGIYLLDDAATFRYVNQFAADSLGYTREELTGGMGIFDIDPEWSPARWRGFVPELRARRRIRVETTHRRRDGRLVPVEVTANHFERDGQAYYLAIVRDITERRAAEAALREREALYRALTENSPDIIIRFDRAGQRIHANSALDRLLGAGDVDELTRRLGPWIGKVCASGAAMETEISLGLSSGARAFNVRLVPETEASGQIGSALVLARDITEQKRAEAASLASEQRLREVTEVMDDVLWLADATTGQTIYVSPAYEHVFGEPRESLVADRSSWRRLVHPEDAERVASATASEWRSGYDIEYRIIRRGVVAWIHDRAFPIRDAAGRTQRVAGVAEDVTRRRELEERLRQSQKMEAVGQLAGGIAHDFNNMLAVVQMQCSLLLQRPADGRQLEDGLHDILVATERAANLTRQLLTFSRQQVARPVDLDITETLGSMSKLLQRVLGEHIELDARLDVRVPRIHADPGMIDQVLMNLAINARDAMPDGGRLAVGVEAVTVDERRAALHLGARAGGYVCLTVSDTGHGIPVADLPRIFEPFFTTKPLGKGTGLGLATVFGIVQQHRGWIEVVSAVGRGTTFTVFLPTCEPAPLEPTVSEPAPVIRGGCETLLLVEDEPAVRSVARRTLEHYGYRVLEADSASRALELWNAEAGGVDLLLTDLIMPGASGWQLAAELLARAPRLRVIFATGYSPELFQRHVRLGPGRTVLQKPYTGAELAACVRRSLDETADLRGDLPALEVRDR